MRKWKFKLEFATNPEGNSEVLEFYKCIREFWLRLWENSFYKSLKLIIAFYKK